MNLVSMDRLLRFLQNPDDLLFGKSLLHHLASDQPKKLIQRLEPL